MNWQRRKNCNVCSAPKVSEVEERTGESNKVRWICDMHRGIFYSSLLINVKISFSFCLLSFFLLQAMAAATMIAASLNIKTVEIQMTSMTTLADANEEMMRKKDAKDRPAIVIEMTATEGK